MMPADKRIVTIGTTSGIDVNVFYAASYSNNVVSKMPIVEIRRANSIQMRLAEVEAVIELLQEALAYWREEGE
jgi:hypothetical protein